MGAVRKGFLYVDMSWTRTNCGDVNAVVEGMHFLRDPLECVRLGVTVGECEPGWQGMEHDHPEEDHEEVYLLLEGAATVEIADETVKMDPGDALHIPAEATRQIRNAQAESRFVLAGAP